MDDLWLIQEEGMWSHLCVPLVIKARLKRALTKKTRTKQMEDKSQVQSIKHTVVSQGRISPRAVPYETYYIARGSPPAAHLAANLAAWGGTIPG